MYNVSSDYIEALRGGAPQFDIKGTVGVVQIRDYNILEGSLSIVRQCASKNEVSIGSVYTAELDVTLINVSVPRNQWVGLTITLQEGLCLADGTYEYIPLGRYIISEAKHTRSGVVIRAYDAMSKFDKAFVLSTTSGKPYALLNYLCSQCGITFGMTQGEVEALPNGNLVWELEPDNDIETYRDYLSWIAQTMSCFAEIGRDGKLYVKKYGSTVTFALNQYQRFINAEFSDFITRYTGLSVVDFKTETTNYYSVTPDNGLTYNLGSNPFLQHSVKSIKDGMRRAVLQGMQAINYTPFTASNISGVYDLGDVIDFEDGLSDGAIGCIMKIDYKYCNSTKLSGFGSDPALANAKSKTDKNIAGLLNKAKDDIIQYYNYLNTEEYTIPSGGWENIISIKFASLKAGIVIFQAEILCDIDTADAVDLEVVYRLDYQTQTFRPVERWYDGQHILNLFYYIPIGANEGHRWQVQLRPSGGSVHIGIDQIRAVMWGQGLVGTEDWSGMLDFEDNFNVLRITNQSMSVVAFDDEISTDVQVPIGDEFEDEFDVIAIHAGMEVVDYDAVVSFNKEIAKLYEWRELAAYNWDATLNGFIWG